MDLMKAIQTQSLDIIKNIVELKGLPIDENWTDYSLLIEALKLGKCDVAEYLLTKNCRVNRENSNMHDTPLHYAVMLKDFNLVRRLLEKKASIEILNEDGDSPLHLAFIHEHSRMLVLLLVYIKLDSVHANPKNKQGLTHLHIASTREDKKLIEMFEPLSEVISDSVSKDSVLWAGYTALHFAVHYKSLEATKVLSTAIAKIKLEERNKITDSCLKLLHKDIEKPLIIADLIFSQSQHYSRYDRYRNLLNFHMALIRNDTEAIKKFIANGIIFGKDVELNKIPGNPLHFAVESNCKESIQLLLNYGAKINDINIENKRPVHLALYNEKAGSNTEIVDTLYKAIEEAEGNYTDDNGLSYLDVAVTRNDLKAVQNYLNMGSNVNSQVLYDNEKFYHFSPLHFATVYEKKEVAELLISYGANVNLSDDGYYGTPLHIAIQTRNVDMIELLLENGADVKAIRPKKKQTVLHSLVDFLTFHSLDEINKLMECMLPYVCRFVTMGCDINAQDINGQTALHYALYSCDYPATALPWATRLLEYGADIDLQDDYGGTPLQVFDYNPEFDGCETLMLLNDHVQKQRALGMMVHPKNINCCKKYFKTITNCKIHSTESKEKMSLLKKERLAEIDRLKKTSISDYWESSLYDLLHKNSKFTNIDFEISLLEEIMKNEDFDKLYPSYGYLIRLQYKRLYENRGIKINQKRAADA